MHSLNRVLVLFLIVGALSMPLSASAALGKSFGGKVLTMLPCSGGMIFYTILPAGKFPVSYIWTPGTITKSAGLPLPGGQVIGTADLPWVCSLGGGLFSSPIFFYGLRMQYIGTSPSGGGFFGL
jgi:hypothetical protein